MDLITFNKCFYILKRLLKSNEKPRNITAARVVILIIYNLCLTLYYLRILVENCPSLTTGTDSKSITIQISNLFIQSLLKVGGSPGQPPPWNTQKWDWVRQIPVVKWQSDA